MALFRILRAKGKMWPRWYLWSATCKSVMTVLYLQLDVAARAVEVSTVVFVDAVHVVAVVS